MRGSIEATNYVGGDYIAGAAARGVVFEPIPADDVVITGYAAISGLGRTQETLDGIWTGTSPVKRTHKFPGFDTQIFSQLPQAYSDPKEYGKLLLETDEKRGQSMFSTLCIALGREALDMAGLLDENGRIDPEKINPYQIASWTSSGYAASDMMTEVHRRLHPGIFEPINPDLALQIFPEQGNGKLTQATGIKGSGGNTMEACATGASNIVEGYKRIRSGEAKVVVAGGIETVINTHPAEAFAAFIALQGAMSKRNDAPKQASRPLDRDRDGFVPGSGGALVVLEELNHAVERGATIYARVAGVGKSMDAYKATELDKVRAADTIALTLYDRLTKQLIVPDGLFLHATSTVIGDLNEAIAHWMVLEGYLEGIPATAIKSVLGHLMGGSGSLNALAAIHALQEPVQSMPATINLDNPDEKILATGLNPVRGDVYVAPKNKPLNYLLAGANGFGGYNAYALLSRYQESSFATL